MKRTRMHGFHRQESAVAYSCLAKIYDKVMAHVDYEGWAEYIDQLFIEYGNSVYSVIDGGCGTGTLASILNKSDYQVSGFDRSFEMARLAKKKGITAWQGDLMNLSIQKGADAILCLYDTVQYFELHDLRSVFAEINRCVVPGGLFIFDVVTEAHIRRYWAHYSDREEGEGWETMRRSWYDKRLRIQNTEFHIYLKSMKRIFHEHHRQYIYRLNDLEEMAVLAGFRSLGRFDEFTMNPGDESSDRVHFVFQQEGA